MSSAQDGSVTRWVSELAGGDADEPARQLWERYFDRLVALARARLKDDHRRSADEEDAALSAFGSLCRGVTAGRFPRLAGRDDLWRLLVTITARKAADQVNRESRKKRGGGRVIGEAALGSAGREGEALSLDQFTGSEPSPAFVSLMDEEIRRLFDRLPDETLRLVALLRMEGYGNEEIAASLDCALRSVERKLERIRALWAEEPASS
jgi:DNA-directed RNA polymerase specialized sigma24 family protein